VKKSATYTTIPLLVIVIVISIFISKIQSNGYTNEASNYPNISSTKVNSYGTSTSVTQKPQLYQNKVSVLMFHDIEPRSVNNDIITPEQFGAKLDYLLRHNFHFITLQQFRNYMGGSQLPDNAVLVTFDDGYESFYKYAYPIMKKRGISGVCFVITGDFSKGALVYTPHMTLKEIKDMIHQDTNTEVQAHTNHLHYKINRNQDALTGKLIVKGVRESKQEYISRIALDLTLCINQLKILNAHPIDTFAYPFGLYNSSAIQVLKQLGVHYAFTTKSGMVSQKSDPMILPRINAGSPQDSPSILYKSIIKANESSENHQHGSSSSLWKLISPILQI
jgi:peptidoglycan/xylan/chitin deacetylase (PgdA/CDA1 family)